VNNGDRHLYRKKGKPFSGLPFDLYRDLLTGADY